MTKNNQSRGKSQRLLQAFTLTLLAAGFGIAVNGQTDGAEENGQKKHRSRRTNAFISATSLNNTAAGLETNVGETIFRHVAGIDPSARPMSKTEIEAKLGDLFATSVLRKGNFPQTTDEIIAAIKTANAGITQSSFMVGEGSQIKATPQIPRSASRDLRYVVAWPGSSNFRLAQSIFLSVDGNVTSGFHQVIAWDNSRQVFNFYELARAQGNTSPFWSWAGDTSFARKPQTIGMGCFACHHNGTLLMKELRRPWGNWNSSFADITAAVVPEAVAHQNLFKNLSSASEFEMIVDTAILTTVRNRIKAPAGSLIQLYLQHLTSNTQMNFESSQILSSEAGPTRKVTALPINYFVNDFALRTVLGINYTAPPLQIDGEIYADFIKAHKFELVQKNSSQPYSVPGSTHFAFFAPAPSAVDGKSIQRLISRNIVSKKLAACILLVDFPNPVFSIKRRSLQSHAMQIDSTSTDFATDYVKKIRATAKTQPDCDTSNLELCSPEQQFLFYWDLPNDGWQSQGATRITKYMTAVAKNLDSVKGVAAQMNLLESRRKEFVGTADNFKEWPLISNLAEFSLLLPQTNLKIPNPLEAKFDGSIGVK